MTFPLIPLDSASIDNNDGLITEIELSQFDSCYGSVLGEERYIRRYDYNLNGVVDYGDSQLFDLAVGRANTANPILMPFSLDELHSKLLTQETSFIRFDTLYVDGIPYTYDSCLVAINENNILNLVGSSQYNENPGWIHIHSREMPIIDVPPGYDNTPYSCEQYTSDTVVAVYKTFGAGICLMASGIGHSYTIYWKGGDWRYLGNWLIVEPMTGQIIDPVTTTNTLYQTALIGIPLLIRDSPTRSGVRHILGGSLQVDWNSKQLSINPWSTYVLTHAEDLLYNYTPQPEFFGMYEKLPLHWNPLLGIVTSEFTNLSVQFMVI